MKCDMSLIQGCANRFMYEAFTHIVIKHMQSSGQKDESIGRVNKCKRCLGGAPKASFHHLGTSVHQWAI